MNSTRLDSSLAIRLFDTSGLIWDANARGQAIASAVREYSRFFPLLRKFGMGNLVNGNLAIGDTTMTAVGGPWAVGDSIILDPYVSAAETVTVTAVSAPSETSASSVGYLETIGISATTKAHVSGAYIVKTALGFRTAAGTPTYALPRDFLLPDTASMQIAFGNKTTNSRQVQFYGDAYTFSGPLVASLFGMSQDFQSFGFVGPFNVNTATIPGIVPLQFGATMGVMFAFTQGDQPLVNIAPAPVLATTLDFSYYGCHAVETIPDAQLELLLQKCIVCAIQAKNADMASRQDGGRVDLEWHPSKSAEQLGKMCDRADRYWAKYTEQQSYMTCG